MTETTTTSPTTNAGPGGLTGKYYCSLRLFDYQRPTPFENSFEKHSDIIELPLPIQLYDQTASAYAHQDLGVVGDAFNLSGASLAENAVLRALSNAPALISELLGGYKSGLVNQRGAEGATDQLKEKLGKKLSGLNKLGGVTKFMSNATGFDPSAFSSAVQQSLGVAPNPNPSVKFSGPILREAGFTWYFNPKNKAESDNIKKIIKKLKSASLPRNNVSGLSGVLEYPKLAQINFHPWDNLSEAAGDRKMNKWGWTENSIIRLKRCFISQVNVNYNPANVPSFFYDNSPVVIELTISLKEIEYLTANEWYDYDADGIKFEAKLSDSTIANNAFQSFKNFAGGVVDSIRDSVS